MSISEKIIAYLVSDKFILAAVSFTVGYVVSLGLLRFDRPQRGKDERKRRKDDGNKENL